MGVEPMSAPDADQQAVLQGIAAARPWEPADALLNAGSSHDPNRRVLLYAMDVLGDRRGLEHSGSQMRDLLDRNGISYRAIQTPSDLRQAAATLLLVFSQDDGRPLAVHRRWGRTVAFDPCTGKCQPLGSDHALQGEAYELFARLPQPLQSLRQLLKVALHGSLLPVLLVLGSGLVLAMLNLSLPLLTATLVQILLPNGDAALLVSTALVVLLIALAAVVVQMFCGLAGVRLESSLALRIEPALWSHVLRLPLPLLEGIGSAELFNRINGIQQLRQLLSHGLITAAVALIVSLSNLALMLIYQPRLTLAAALFSAGSGVLMALLVLQSTRREQLLQHSQARLQAMALDTVRGLPQLRVSGSEPFVFRRWMERVVQLGILLRRRDATADNLQILARLLTPLGQVVVFVMLLNQLNQGSSDASGLGANQRVAAFVAFEAASFAFNSQISTFAIQAATSLGQLWVLARRSRVLLFASPETVQSRPAIALELQGSIELQNLQVHHADAAEPLLRDLNLSVAKGSYTAITGPSGCGKTTLLRCLLRLIEPTAGVISIDGVELQQLAIDHYRRQLGVVLQNAALPSGSIAEVVRAGRHYSHEAIWHALEIACVADDVARMPMRLETLVDESGLAVSGGQRQRLVLARALLGQPKVLLLDEATSALDALSQAAVMRNLANLSITRIAIAHRRSTLEAADQIAVIAGGRIGELGRFAELSRNLDGDLAGESQRH